MDILDRPEHLLDDALQDQRGPQALWAKLDRIEASPTGQTFALFDGVDADWFDEVRPQHGALIDTDTTHGEFTSVVAVPAQNWSLRQQWYRLDLGAGRSGAPLRAWDNPVAAEIALQADSVTGLATPRPIVDLRPATRAEAARLGAAGSMSDLPDADVDELHAVLDSVPPVDSIGVLDVGQGNWNVLLHRGCARLLFDLGGGVMSHLRSFPGNFSTFCFAARPPVVLSHWDWDHWSSAARFPEAQTLTWLVPRQGSLGPTHARFLAAIRAQGRVHVASLAPGQKVGPPHVRLQQARGPARSRNATGLAMVVGCPCGDKRALLPGDAGYSNLALPDSLTSVVVPHHGGRSRSSPATLPANDGARCGRAVISVGFTSKRHPTRAALDLHRRWAAALLLTSSRALSVDEPAHVELHWDSPASATKRCCPYSALPLQQR